MASIKVELIETADGEKVYIDLNDVLDVFVKEKGKYIIVFADGGIYYNVKMRKIIYDKFIKLKKKRGQTDNDM